MSEERAAYEVHPKNTGSKEKDGRSVRKEFGPWIKLSTEFRDRYLSDLKGSQLSVFLCLALHLNQDFRAWPSVSIIAKETGYDRRTVSRALEKLVRKKLIVIEKRRGEGQQFANNRYEVQAFAGFGKSNPWDNMLPGTDRGDINTKAIRHLPTTVKSPLKKNQSSKKNQDDESQTPSSSGITEFLLDHSPNVSSSKNLGLIDAEQRLADAGATLEDCEDAELNGFLEPYTLVPTNSEIHEPWPVQIAGGVLQWLELTEGRDGF